MTAQEIKELRLGRGLTQEQFARKVGVSWTTVNRWEHGRAPSPLANEKLIKLNKK